MSDYTETINMLGRDIERKKQELDDLNTALRVVESLEQESLLNSSAGEPHE